jgi:hypothetical protein
MTAKSPRDLIASRVGLSIDFSFIIDPAPSSTGQSSAFPSCAACLF